MVPTLHAIRCLQPCPGTGVPVCDQLANSGPHPQVDNTLSSVATSNNDDQPNDRRPSTGGTSDLSTEDICSIRYLLTHSGHLGPQCQCEAAKAHQNSATSHQQTSRTMSGAKGISIITSTSCYPLLSLPHIQNHVPAQSVYLYSLPGFNGSARSCFKPSAILPTFLSGLTS